MAQQVRTLKFAVTTSLLAVPVLVGCKPVHTNEGPQPEPPHVNEGPEPEPADTAAPEPAAEGGETPAAEGGGDAPAADPPTVADGKPKVMVNPGPAPEPKAKP
jgi:hypothetical protein